MEGLAVRVVTTLLELAGFGLLAAGAYLAVGLWLALLVAGAVLLVMSWGMSR